VVTVKLEAGVWARQQFGECKLGDKRRTERAVKYAAAVVDHPDGSTPDQTEDAADCKGVYRLFDCEQVTFRALAEPHWRATRARAEGVCLILGDTMETDFGNHRKATGLGPTGHGSGYGFFMHSGLMVQAETSEIVGMAGQEIFHRQPRVKSENSYQRTQRRRESEVWGRVIDDIGPAPAKARYLHVLDRGADNIEVFCHSRQQGCGWVVRVAQLTRKVELESGQRCSVREALQDPSTLGTYTLSLQARSEQRAREATLEVRAVRVTMLTPERLTPYLRSIGPQRIEQWIVEVREVDAPPGVAPLHWVLYTSEPILSLDDARRIVGYYERRWLIEEYHKCLKTGCRVEGRHYSTARRLEAVTGILAVVAVRLLQIKTVARANPDLPADQVAPRAWVRMLGQVRPKARLVTARDFFRELAKLGGFLGRKSDGEPGWITLWRGHEKLKLLLRGATAERKRCG
jgi:hypothetical protein